MELQVQTLLAFLLLGLCSKSPRVEGEPSHLAVSISGDQLQLECMVTHTIGVEFSLRGRSIPTDGSGRLLITDISLHNRQTSTSDEEALICLSSRNVAELHTPEIDTEWYLDPEVKNTTNTVSGERISEGSNDKGWTVNRDTVRVDVPMKPFHRVVRLKRASETALEGKFTCHISNDSNNKKFLLILYPSEFSMLTLHGVSGCVTLFQSFYWRQWLMW